MGELALERGLVDEIGSYEKILMQQFPNAKLVFYSAESKLQKLEDAFYVILKITQSSSYFFYYGSRFLLTHRVSHT
jgi:ClpP class serine protease